MRSERVGSQSGVGESRFFGRIKEGAQGRSASMQMQDDRRRKTSWRGRAER